MDTHPAAVVDRTAARLARLPWRTYPLRVLGLGLGFLAPAAVLYENGSHWVAWAWAVFGCLLWPHLAFLIASRSRDPLRAELRNFLVDSALAGSLVALMHFNLLPSAVLLAVVVADKINTGVRRLWLHSLPGMLAGMLGVGLLTGFAFSPHTSMLVVAASLPLLIIHTLAVSLSSYRLVRRVQAQNRQLEALNRVDSLTGLESRAFWEGQAEALLRAHQADGRPASLVLVDIDRFKAINDRYGHAVGDDVLRSIAELMRRSLGPEAHAGRLGGDEFAAVLPDSLPAATELARQFEQEVLRLAFPRHPGLRCSISLGLARAPDGSLGLREWIEAADRAMYEAKAVGRGHEPQGERGRGHRRDA
jgi:diguanylate cyclase